MDGNEARRQLFVPLASKRRNAEVITSRSAGRLPGLADAPRFVYGSTIVRNLQKNSPKYSKYRDEVHSVGCYRHIAPKTFTVWPANTPM